MNLVHLPLLNRALKLYWQYVKSGENTAWNPHTSVDISPLKNKRILIANELASELDKSMEQIQEENSISAQSCALFKTVPLWFLKYH